ncbi:MAG: tRNA(Met) cytidine acetate ligase [Saccharofermentanales bacterium]
MITVGIICEYNPLHNGHLHQIRKVREIFGEDCAVIAVMSGNFVQRGEAAVLDKWSRARAALQCGVNLVIELPAVYAAASAELFASGGVAIAASTGICDYLVFGSESGDLHELEAIADVLAEEPEAFRAYLKQHLDEGLSFSVSRSLAIEEYGCTSGASDILACSNNILAIEYLKAIRRRGIKRMKPYTIRREGQSYNETRIVQDTHASASAIRESLQRPDLDAASILRTLGGSMPAEALASLVSCYRRQSCILSREVFADNLFQLLLSNTPEGLSLLPGMGEGLGNRLRDLAASSTAGPDRLGKLIESASTRRYPRSRVRRALIHMLLGMTKEDFAMAAGENAPYYLRVLGFDKKGRYLLKIMRKTARLPIITRGSDFREYAANPENQALLRMAQIDINATDIWMQKTTGECGRDFTTPPAAP